MPTSAARYIAGRLTFCARHSVMISGNKICRTGARGNRKLESEICRTEFKRIVASREGLAASRARTSVVGDSPFRSRGKKGAPHNQLDQGQQVALRWLAISTVLARSPARGPRHGTRRTQRAAAIRSHWSAPAEPTSSTASRRSSGAARRSCPRRALDARRRRLLDSRFHFHCCGRTVKCAAFGGASDAARTARLQCWPGST